MQKLGRFTTGIVAACAVAAFMFVTGPQKAEARAQYLKEFKTKYEKDLGGATLNCNVCHGKDKKVRSDYAAELEKAIGEQNSKDATKIKAAFDVAAAKPSNVDGMTYGELLESGQLPAPVQE